ncbi:MAG: hypothetical protein Q3962_07320 [Corynebacterium sp.]|nr:hypothetical protein [Corynebacterium sp.]
MGKIPHPDISDYPAWQVLGIPDVRAVPDSVNPYGRITFMEAMPRKSDRLVDAFLEPYKALYPDLAWAAESVWIDEGVDYIQWPDFVCGASAEYNSFGMKIAYEAIEASYEAWQAKYPDNEKIREEAARFWCDEEKEKILLRIDLSEALEAEKDVYYPFVKGWDDRPGRKNPEMFMDMNTLKPYKLGSRGF